MQKPVKNSARTQSSDVEVPEINTDFMVFNDKSFVDRFDAGFADTVPMKSPAEPGSREELEEAVANMLEINFDQVDTERPK